MFREHSNDPYNVSTSVENGPVRSLLHHRRQLSLNVVLTPRSTVETGLYTPKFNECPVVSCGWYDVGVKISGV